MNKSILSAVVAFGLAVILSLVPGEGLAIQGIGASPTSQELTLMPGQTSSSQITVINDGDNDVTYKLYAADYRVSGEQYSANFTNTGQGPNLSAVSWFLLPVGTAVVKARDEKVVNYTIAVPKDAAVGGHYVAVFVQTIPTPVNGSTIISRVDRVASLYYMAVGGHLDTRGQLLPLGVPWLQPASPVQAAVRVKNTGNVHFQVNTTSQLSTPFGKAGHPVTVRGEVLPGTTRRLDIKLPAPYPIGLYRADVTVKYLGKTVHQTGWLFMVPKLTFIIVSLTVLALVVFGVVRLVRRTRRKQE